MRAGIVEVFKMGDLVTEYQSGQKKGWADNQIRDAKQAEWK